MADEHDPTARFYAENAQAYASRQSTAGYERLDGFLAKLEPGARILELGCGGGRDSARMMALGFDVRPTDGTAEIAEQAAARLGVPVPVLRFEDIALDAAVDGVWASACLLHVPRADLPSILAKIHAALRSGGVFYASFKAGEGEGHDALQRFFNYPSADWLRTVYGNCDWASLEIDERAGGAYDDKPTQWLHVTVVKP